MKKFHLTHILLPSLLLCATACNDKAIVEQTPEQSSSEILIDVVSQEMLALHGNGNSGPARGIKSYPICQTSEGMLTLVCVERPMSNASPNVDLTATRAVPVTNDNFGSLYGMFRAAAYVTGGTDEVVMSPCNVVYDANATANKRWTPDSKPCYYPADGSGIDFWAYAPVTLPSGSGTRSDVTYADGKASFSYTMPAHNTDNADATRQMDLITAGIVNQTSGTVNLVFNHALSAIKFQTTRIPDGTVKKISINNIKNAGSCVYDPASTTKDDDGNTVYYTWTLGDTSDSYTQTFNQEVTSADHTKLTDKDPKTTFIVMPQTTPETSYMEIEFEWDASYVATDGVQKFVADISGTEWRPGYEYLYNIITIPYETANCYIADKPGLHLVPAFCMGNRQDYILSAPEGHTYKADVLWSDCGLSNDSRTDGSAASQDAITDLNYFVMDDGKGYFVYRVAEDGSGNAVRGNVVVALYDENAIASETGKPAIIWTWHLWLTEKPETTYTDGGCDIGTYETDGYTFQSDATDGPLAIMDRNLGATSANPADGWATFGLYYQNGRRDPFIGTNGSVGSPNVTGLDSGTGGIPNGTNNKGQTLYIGGDGGGNTVYYDETEAFSAYSTRTYWNNALSDGWKVYLFAAGSDKTQGRRPSLGATRGGGGGDYTTDPAVFDIPWSIHEPMTFSGNTSYGMQWTWYLEMDNARYMDTRFSAYGEHGKTGLTDGGHQAYWSRFKTIMDPCPAGWTVLGDEDKDKVMGGGLGTGIYFDNNPKTKIEGGIYGASFTYTYSGASGSDLNGTTFTSWWPAAGVRATNGCMSSVGYQGFYLYYDHVAADHGGHGMRFTVGTTDGGNLAAYGNGITTNHATPVRCVRAKQDVPKTGKK